MAKQQVKRTEIEFIYSEQVFEEIVEQLKKEGLYKPNPHLLYRAMLTEFIPTLEETGNDRDAHYNEKSMEIDQKTMADARAKGKRSVEADVEAYEICEEFPKLKMSDFIFATPEDKNRDYLKYGLGDCALVRLTTQYAGPTSILVYDANKFKDLNLHHGWEFIDKTKKGKLEALLKIFDIANTERRH